MGTAATRGGRVVAHVGLHKTGTTWLETRLFPKVRNFRFLPSTVIRPALFDAHAFAFEPRSARARLGLDEGANVLLSDKAFSGSLHSGGHLGALGLDRSLRLHATCPEAMIVIFIRNQLDAVVSAYRQYVLRGGTFSLHRYVFTPTHTTAFPRFDLGFFDYALVYRHWRKLYGADSVRLYLYEDFAEENRRFVERFTAEHGMDVDLGGLELRRENEGYPNLALRAARFMNAFYAGEVGYKYYLLNIPRGHTISQRVAGWISRRSRGWSGTTRLTSGDEASIRENYRESNAWLAGELSLDLGRHGYPV